jgi:predicted GH43/DUF377 family glycosyl hydrolase
MKSRTSFISIALLTAIIVLLSTQIVSAVGWYNSSWQYRRQITVPNPGTTLLTDFQVQITLNSTFDFSKPKNDGNDIRVTLNDGLTLIPFWIERWDAVGQQATIWVKVPSIPTSGVSIYLYYGNPNPNNPIETPPTGPFTRAVGNPINPIGDPGSGTSLLAENIVYDDVSGHYWMVFANYRSGSYGVGLVWSDAPTDATSWHWYGNVYTQGGGGSFAPHIIKENGYWYIFYAILPNIVYIKSLTINGTYSSPSVILSPTLSWETYRVDEPYVFKRNDGKWIMIYMADAGGVTEQVGYASADAITGPYTKFPGNPCIPFGPSGSFDAGTVADPWVYEYHGVYYIGYTVSPTKNSPWQTAIATTTDWQTFTKGGVIFPVAASGWDNNNSFRGAVSRIDNTYVFSYTGDSYKMGIATQPVYMNPVNNINNGDAVFNFFDGFSGTGLDGTKWTFASGSSSQVVVSGGQATITASGTYVRINANSSFGMDFIGETQARHPNQGTQDKIVEVGFADGSWNTVRIVDDFLLGTTYWQRQAKLAGGSDIFTNMAQPANQNWHVFHTYRQSPNIAGFQIDNYTIETTSTNVPTMSLPPFLMSFGASNALVVDWTRVRKWAGSDPVPSVGTELIQPPPLVLNYTKTDVSCFGGSDGAINITVGGGSGSYTYLWFPGGQFIEDISGLSAGTYSVVVTDGYGTIINSGDIIISQPTALLVNSAITSPLVCSEGTATILISATGGTSPYSGTGSFTQSVGTTIYNVTDAKGCQGNVSVSVGEPVPWYNEYWEYRRAITVANPNATTLSDFQVMISLDNSFDFTKALTNGSDIRVTANDGTTLIPFWIETWNPSGILANIWIKVPSIPVAGTTVYLYYGNPNPTIDIPAPIEVPPTGPFTRAVGNPIVPSGATGTSLLAENIVYDDVTNHYWMCLANYSQSAISLCYSDNPTDPGAWHWSGNVITSFTQFYSGAPHLLKNGTTWYLFYADRPDIKVATASNVAGPYTIYPTPMLSPSGPAPAWDNFRVDEPYVFFRESDGKWVLVYMADSGGAVEQVGYATADNILGPYTAFAGNPCLAFGVPGSFDAGTIADPWVYRFNDVYYIGYTVSPTNQSPWQTACATTTDWLTFTKLGVIFPVAISGWDAVNSFRGAVTRVGDTYVFSYTGDGYKMGIATQPVFMTPPTIINNVDAVFDFYDGFEGTALDGSKWYFGHGNSSQASVSGGNLTLTHTSGDFPSLLSQSTFGMDYSVEVKGRHPQQGILNMVIETGFNANFGDMVRIADDFPTSTVKWSRQAKLSSQGGDPGWATMAQNADQNWHVFKVFRQSPGTAGFQIDETPAETTTNSVPSGSLPVFLMSYTESAPNQFIVDWIRVRKYASSSPISSVGSEQNLINRWIGAVSTDWNIPGNWSHGVPDICSKVLIPFNLSNQPHVTALPSSPVQCRDLTIEAGAVVTIDPGKALTVNGVLTNNAGNTGLVIKSNSSGAVGSLLYNGSVPAKVEQYLSKDTWHMVASPISNGTIGSFMWMYLYKYLEPTNTWTILNYPLTLPLNVGEGYFVWPYSYNPNYPPSPDFAIYSGNLNYQNVNLTLSNTGASNKSGWNLIGNPYPCALQWNLNPSWNRINVTPSTYIKNPASGNYVVWNAYTGIGTNPNGGYIAPTQSFWVRAADTTGTPASLTIPQSQRLHNNASFYKNGESVLPEQLLLEINGLNREDKTIVGFIEQATPLYDSDFDALYLEGDEDAPSLYSLVLGNRYALNQLPSIQDFNSVPVNFESKEPGNYLLFASWMESFEPEIPIYLEDRKEGNFHDLRANAEYNFASDPSDDPGRFTIHFSKPNQVNENILNPIRVFASESAIFIQFHEAKPAEIVIYDLMGRELIRQKSANENLLKINVLAGTGYYLVKVQTSDQIVTDKIFLK